MVRRDHFLISIFHTDVENFNSTKTHDIQDDMLSISIVGCFMAEKRVKGYLIISSAVSGQAWILSGVPFFSGLPWFAETESVLPCFRHDLHRRLFHLCFRHASRCRDLFHHGLQPAPFF
jgi:hypothetical protein